jgi:hypothetical protein
VDGATVGFLAAGDTLTVRVHPGWHDVKVIVNSETEGAIGLDIPEGSIARLACVPSALLLGSLVRTKKTKLDLVQTDEPAKQD